ncbi:hypothetical protein CC86DRAFT_346460 [Ophiobolus disseminans]|uniref:PHD-type domain-containing protein n=1 Tax=Ophiobolus disseminans TaxID=1469910 RepID=A0A6A7A4W2_9PLEO|nr:hypothetical protein CC86DRAFT_346460 [Ophiobolus disseminans]
MSSSIPPNDPPNVTGGAASATPQSNSPAWSANMSTFPANGSAGAAPSFPQFSASTAAILERLQGRASGPSSGSAAFEAKKAEILQNYVTSDKLPTPPPITNNARRGRGGRGGTPNTVRGEGASPAGASSGRGSGRGRGRGRGRRGGRGGKRKRNDSDEDGNDDDNSDVSDSYTPLPTRTKSGRSVNKPVVFVPTIPEPTQGTKRRKSTKTLLAAKCKTCHRDVDPSNNRIVFCDACSTAYHQYCHTPSIPNDVVTVLEKEWLCSPCQRLKASVATATEELVAAANLSMDQKRGYFTTLPHAKLVDLLLIATVRHPELPIYPPNVQSLIPTIPDVKHQPPPPAPVPQRFPQPQYQHPSAFQHSSLTSPPNGHTPTGQIPHSHNFSSHSDMDPSEAQLLGESRDQPQQRPVTMDLAGHQYEEDDGYDTDPPAHYPKAGQGFARTLRPESEDLNWLVDDNFEVFSHGWKGDGTGMGADGTLDGTLDGMSSGQKVA